jgi:electron transfer flavoprotein alpha subunit
MNEVWIWAEQRNGRLMGVSLELLGKGLQLSKELKAELATILIGDRVQNMAQELVNYGADKVYIVEDERLNLYQSDVYARIIAEMILEHHPEIFLLGGTAIGMDLAPRVAAKVKTGLTAHCVDLYIDKFDDKSCLFALVPGFGGNLMVKIVCPQQRPQMATVKPGVMEKSARDEGRKGEIIKVETKVEDDEFRSRTIELVEQEPVGIPLEEAEVVVAGGWGLNSAGGFKLVEELAEVLNGVVAGTRPAVDAGWISEERMLGSSGKTINPKLLISVGASGQMHFTTGFLKSKVILAINDNPKSPIFEACDIGIVGDLCKIVPCLVEEFKQIKGGG